MATEIEVKLLRVSEVTTFGVYVEAKPFDMFSTWAADQLLILCLQRLE